MTKFCPSTYPNSRMPWRKLRVSAVGPAASESQPILQTRRRGWASAANGRVAVPLSTRMNVRRFIGSLDQRDGKWPLMLQIVALRRGPDQSNRPVADAPDGPRSGLSGRSSTLIKKLLIFNYNSLMSCVIYTPASAKADQFQPFRAPRRVPGRAAQRRDPDEEIPMGRDVIYGAGRHLWGGTSSMGRDVIYGERRHLGAGRHLWERRHRREKVRANAKSRR